MTDKPQTMAEKVAQAIQGPLGISYADAEFAARRAIEAMRDAPIFVLQVGASHFYDSSIKEAGIGWCLMIDAALKEGK